MKRTRGFNLQRVSRALNGLPAMKVDRSTMFGSPFLVSSADPSRCVTFFRECLERAIRGHPMPANMQGGAMSDYEILKFKRIAMELDRLRGRNLACWCPLPAEGQPDLCHAAILLRIANE